MRGLSISLAVLLVAGACTTRQRIAGGGLGMAVTGIYLGFSTDPKGDEEIGTREKVGIGLLLTGLVTLFVAAALEESEARSDSKPREIRATRTTSAGPDPAVIQAQKKRDQAWALTKQAQEAARANDCAKVTELSAQVGAVDRDFYGEVFMKDVAIQQCFRPTDTPPTPAPAPAPAPTP